jgi:hypothetical protein
MKKIVASLVAGLFLFSVANAQMKMAVGLKGGLAVTNAYGDDATTLAQVTGGVKAPRITVGGGAAFDLGINNWFGLSIEALYTQKGLRIETIQEIADWYSVIKMNYLDIPILAKVNLMQGSVVPYIVAGPQVSLKLGGKVGGTGNDGVLTTDQDLTAMAGLDYGAVVGAGIGYTAGPGKVVVEYRFGMGIKPADIKTGQDNPITGVQAPVFGVKNTVPFTLSIGYMYNL